MLHIATVHFNSFRWIPIQARELRRNVNVPYATWASLEGIDPSYGEHFDHVVDQGGTHPEKLNRLAAEIGREAAGDDLLMFLDGDAFPIGDPGPLIESGLAAAPLLAVRRAENGDDPQPHPCFCVTQVATWRELQGDWSAGPLGTGPPDNPVADVGGRLLRQLELSETPWVKILRSNRRNLHPVFFGIYGDTIYHHGAGFRRTFSRADLAQLKSAGASHGSEGIKVALRNLQQSQELFRRIQRDDPGWLAELM